MYCQLYKLLYKLFPVIRRQEFPVIKHLTTCPTCRVEFDTDNPIDFIGVKPTTVEREKDMDVWPRVEEQLLALENSKSIYETPRPRIPNRARTWGWALAGAGAAVLALVLLVPPWDKYDREGTRRDMEFPTGNDQIVINSVTIENQPAKPIFFQPGNKNRLIVWVKKI